MHAAPHGLPHVVYVIVTGKPEGGLPPWMAHMGPHAGHGPMEHRRHSDDEDDDDEDEEQEEEIEKLREQVKMLRKEVHVIAEILKELKRDR